MPTTTFSKLATEYSWLNANMPIPPAFEKRWLLFGSEIYGAAAAVLPGLATTGNGAAVPGLGKEAAAVLAQLQNYGAAGCTMDVIIANTGMAETAVSRALATLRSKNLITGGNTVGEPYIAVGASNVQGIQTTQPKTGPGRPRKTATTTSRPPQQRAQA